MSPQSVTALAQRTRYEVVIHQQLRGSIGAVPILIFHLHGEGAELSLPTFWKV